MLPGKNEFLYRQYLTIKGYPFFQLRHYVAPIQKSRELQPCWPAICSISRKRSAPQSQ
jgi:hypothetical protein